jgi:hypothetical protein
MEKGVCIILAQRLEVEPLFRKKECQPSSSAQHQPTLPPGRALPTAVALLHKNEVRKHRV